MIRPTKGTITQGFSSQHMAVDYANSIGTPIIAPHAGKVTIAGNLGECGIAVEIDGGQFKSRLCHNSSISVSLGQNVSEGQQVAKMGYTGKTIPAGPGGTHLHWVLWINGTRVDPEKHLGDSEDMAASYEVANLYAQEMLFRDMPRTEWERFHRGKTRDQLFDDFRDAPEREKKLAAWKALEANAKILTAGRYIVK